MNTVTQSKRPNISTTHFECKTIDCLHDEMLRIVFSFIDNRKGLPLVNQRWYRNYLILYKSDKKILGNLFNNVVASPDFMECKTLTSAISTLARWKLSVINHFINQDQEKLNEYLSSIKFQSYHTEQILDFVNLISQANNDCKCYGDSLCFPHKKVRMKVRSVIEKNEVFTAYGLANLCPQFKSVVHYQIVNQLCLLENFDSALSLAKEMFKHNKNHNGLRKVIEHLVQHKRFNEAINIVYSYPQQLINFQLNENTLHDVLLFWASRQAAIVGETAIALKTAELIPTKEYYQFTVQEIATQCAALGDLDRALEISNSTPYSHSQFKTKLYIANKYIPSDKEKAIEVFMETIKTNPKVGPDSIELTFFCAGLSWFYDKSQGDKIRKQFLSEM